MMFFCFILGNERCPGSSVSRCQPRCDFDYLGCNIKLITDVKNWYECSKLCGNTKNCKVWTWGNQNHRCYVKHSVCNPGKLHNYDSGSNSTHIGCEASCGEKIVIKLLNFFYLDDFAESCPNINHMTQ